jgi:putative tricarboxylic transport membrane protein
MRKFDIPIGPMVLGVILGNMLDQNFRRAMLIFEDKSLWQILIDRPLGTLLIGVVLITFINGIWPKKNKRKA